MADLGGQPVLRHVIERVRRATRVHQIVVASPDLELVEYAYAHKVLGFHAPEYPENVLLRYIKAADWSGADVVVRITADCPLICPEIIDNCVKGFLGNRVDISTNVLRRTFPKGLDVEVIHRYVLRRIIYLTDDPRYRQHVTLFAYENQPLFKFYSIFNNDDFSYLNLCVDIPKDLDKLKEFVNHCDSIDYTFDDIVRYFIGGEHLQFPSLDGCSSGNDPETHGPDERRDSAS